jgi:hypothetical protein
MSRKYLVLAGIVIALVLICMYIVYRAPLDSAVDYGVHVYTDKESYVIGDIVTFGIANDGTETVKFYHGAPWELQKKENGEWIQIGSHCGYDVEWALSPGTKTGDPNVLDDEYKWDTSGKHRGGAGVEVWGNITPGQYRIVSYGVINDTGHLFIKEFTIEAA